MLRKKQRVVFVLWLDYCLLELHLIPAVINIYLAINHLEKLHKTDNSRSNFGFSLSEKMI